MNWNLRSRKWIAAGLSAAATCSALGGGYLAMDGPPPLRFFSRFKPGVEKTVLPPLALSSTDTSTTDPTSQDPSLQNLDEEPILGPMPPNTGSGMSSQPIVIPPAALSPPTVMPGLPVTPQVLLSYFGAPGTNGVNPVVLAPVSFVPPQPGAAGSSRATYRQVP